MARNKKEKGKNDHLIEGSIMLGIGVVFMLILLGVFGRSGKAVADFLVGALGYAVYAYFLALIILGVTRLFNMKMQNMPWGRVLAVLMFVAMVVSLLHCVSSSQYIEGGYVNYLKTCYTQHNTAGGVVAAVFLYPLLLVNYVGIVLCSILALAFGVMFVFYDSVISYFAAGKKRNTAELVDFNKQSEDGSFEIIETSLSRGDDKKSNDFDEFVPLGEVSAKKVDFNEVQEDEQPTIKFSRLRDRNLLNVEPVKEEPEKAEEKLSSFDNAYNILYGNNSATDKKEQPKPAQPTENAEDYKSYTNQYRKDRINENLGGTGTFVDKLADNAARQNEAAQSKESRDYFSVDSIKLDKVDSQPKADETAEIAEQKPAEEAFEHKPLFDFSSLFGAKKTEEHKIDDISIEDDEVTTSDDGVVTYEPVEQRTDFSDVPVEDKTASHREVEGFESLLRRQKEEREQIAKANVEKRHNLTESFEDDFTRREQRRKERSDKGGTHNSGKVAESIATEPVKPEENFANMQQSTDFAAKTQPPEPQPEAQEKKAKPRIKMAPYKYPPIELLADYDSRPPENENFDDKIAILESTLSEFGIDAKVNNVVTGPTFSRLELVMPKGIPVKRVLSYVDDIAMCLEVKSVRCQIPIPGKNAFGVEIPNNKRGKVGLKSVIESESFIHNKHKLAFAVGQNCDGEVYTADLSAMPHLLIAGATGAGKSVCLNSLIVSLMYKYTPEELRLLLVDPKQVELNMYNRIPHMLIPEAVSDKDKTLNLLDWAIEEMELRYTMFKDRRVQKITDYNAIIDPKKEDKLPYIVIIIDEVGDFMMVMKKELEERIVRLTQKARAAGIHLILATQRPSVDVITGTIKANLPARIAFAVASFTDSKTILDQGGAEKLLRYGDMIFSDGVNEPVRLQGTLIEGNEVNAICDYVRDNNECYFDKDIEEYILNTNNSSSNGNVATGAAGDASGEQDDLFVRALYHVVTTGTVSISKLQRKFGIGFPRAARLVDTMEELGYISPAKDNKQREILIDMPLLRSRYGDVSLE